jgi:hypothetical protein
MWSWHSEQHKKEKIRSSRCRLGPPDSASNPGNPGLLFFLTASISRLKPSSEISILSFPFTTLYGTVFFKSVVFGFPMCIVDFASTPYPFKPYGLAQERHSKCSACNDPNHTLSQLKPKPSALGTELEGPGLPLGSTLSAAVSITSPFPFFFGGSKLLAESPGEDALLRLRGFVEEDSDAILDDGSEEEVNTLPWPAAVVYLKLSLISLPSFTATSSNHRPRRWRVLYPRCLC